MLGHNLTIVLPMKIRTKLGLTYLTVSFLALVAISISLYFFIKNTLTSDLLNHLESVSTIQKHRIENILQQNLERVRLVSSRTQLRISLNRFLNSGEPKEIDKIKLIIADALKSIESFTVMSILDLDGNVLVSTDNSKVGHSYRDYEFFPIAQHQNNAEYFFLDNNNNLKLYLSGPLLIDGRTIGVLLIESEADTIVSLVKDFSGLRKTGETVLGKKSKDGNHVIYLVPLRFDQGAALLRKAPTADQSNAMVKAVSTSGQLLTTATDYRGHEVLIASNYMPKTHWGIVVKIDEQEAFEPINTLVRSIVFVSLFMILVIVLVSYVLANIISKPVVELTKVAHRINEGGLSDRANIKTNDEVGELANTFNNMANTLIRAQYDLEKSNKELENHRDHLEEMVSIRTRELERSNQELESFSYSVSHDLRSPLRAIDGYSHILMEELSDQLNGNCKECFQRIRLASQRMGELIDDLLKLSRINRKALKRERINLSSKIQSIFSSLMKDSKRHVDFIFQPDIYVNADEGLMDVVASNLISNALKYTEKSESPRVEFGKMMENSETVLYIKDNGIGFDNQYADKIFGAFQRLVKQDEYPGNGIGLATVSRIIQRHGGRIWAESETGKGAVFYFTLPTAPQS